MMRPGIAALFAAAACAWACDAPAPPDDSPETAPAAQPGTERPAEGRFRRARDAAANAALTPEQQRMAAELEAIGYVSGSQPARAAGVTRHEPAAAPAGLHFFASGHGETAWRYRSADALGAPVGADARGPDRWWRRAYLLPNGDLIAIVTGAGLIKLDASSNLIWAAKLHAHHDLAFGDDGTLWVLTRRIHLRPEIHPDRPVVDDGVAVLDSNGRLLREFSLLDAAMDGEIGAIWRRSGSRSGDVFHTNSIEILDGTGAAANAALRAGNLLISILKLDALAIVDPESERVVWAHAGGYRAQHDPKILANGHLLLFDNNPPAGPSAVLELDPASMDAVWSFRGSAQEPFFSKTCGTAERLANGNTLITETDFGRAFEVTPDGRVVWEFYNPHRAGEDDAFIATLPEVIRLPPDFPSDWIDASTVAAPAARD